MVGAKWPGGDCVPPPPSCLRDNDPLCCGDHCEVFVLGGTPSPGRREMGVFHGSPFRGAGLEKGPE